MENIGKWKNFFFRNFGIGVIVDSDGIFLVVSSPTEELTDI